MKFSRRQEYESVYCFPAFRGCQHNQPLVLVERFIRNRARYRHDRRRPHHLASFSVTPISLMMANIDFPTHICLKASNNCLQRFSGFLPYESWPAVLAASITFIDTSAVTVAGLVFGAENALLAHEAERRQEENVLRKQARYDLARRGLIATESEIAKWRTERDESSGSS